MGGIDKTRGAEREPRVEVMEKVFFLEGLKMGFKMICVGSLWFLGKIL